MCSAEDGCLSVGSFPSYWGWERSGRPDGLRARGQILISAQRTVLSVSEGETEVKACPPERGRVCAEGWETPRSPCEHRTRHLMGSTVHKQHTYTHTLTRTQADHLLVLPNWALEQWPVAKLPRFVCLRITSQELSGCSHTDKQILVVFLTFTQKRSHKHMYTQELKKRTKLYYYLSDRI